MVRLELEQRGIEFAEPTQATIRNHDVLIVSLAHKALPKLRDLSTVEDVLWVLSEGSLVKTAEMADDAVSRVSAQSVFEALQGVDAAFGRRRRPRKITFNSFVKQDCDRPVYRRVLAEKIVRRVSRMFQKWRHSDPAALEFWGLYYGEKLTITLRMSRNEFRKRTYRVEERAAALRPTLAAALGVLSTPRPDDRVLDPMCGTGTVIVERARLGAARELACGDVDRKAVEIARASFESARPHAHLKATQWDGVRLPLRDASFDAVLSNLPYGKTYKGPCGNAQLYVQLLGEFSRVLAPNGRMVLMTSDVASIQDAARRAGLSCVVRARVSVLGVWAGIFSVGKLHNLDSSSREKR